MAKNGLTFIVAVICILISAAAAIYLILNWLKPTSAITNQIFSNQITPSQTLNVQTPSEAIIRKPTDVLPNINLTNKVDASTDDLQLALKTLNDYNHYLNNGEYVKAAELFDWESLGDLQTVFGKYYVAGDNAKTLANVCKDKNYCLRFYKVLRSKKDKVDQYSFVVQFQTENNKIFVNSAHVSGTFVTNTDFLYTVKKIGGKFKVTNPPNFFVTEAE